MSPVAQAPGLTHMLELAGRTIAQLEDRVEQLTTALGAERQQRAEVEALLARLRTAPAGGVDTGDVDPLGPRVTETVAHETDPARSST